MAAGQSDDRGHPPAAPPHRRWSELTTEDFVGAGSWVAILPIAATEQHGPHLPTGTDAMIGDRLIEAALDAMPDDVPAVVLPSLPIGKSDEHANFPGTLTLSASTLVAMLVEIGESVARAGVERLVIMSAHGGNSEAMAIAARDLRRRCAMVVVATSWARMGQPEGLFDAAELRHGIHAGDVETSLMLHLAPDQVQRHRARNFVSRGLAMERDFAVLRATGPTGFGWLAEDLNGEGACGDASVASADKGSAAARHAVARFITLLGEVSRFTLEPPARSR